MLFTEMRCSAQAVSTIARTWVRARLGVQNFLNHGVILRFQRRKQPKFRQTYNGDARGQFHRSGQRTVRKCLPVLDANHKAAAALVSNDGSYLDARLQAARMREASKAPGLRRSFHSRRSISRRVICAASACRPPIPMSSWFQASQIRRQ